MFRFRGWLAFNATIMEKPMLDLAIAVDTDKNKTTVVETNRGFRLKAPTWPHDCDFQMVAFNPSGHNCHVVWADGLAEDIALALTALGRTSALKGRKPDWYRRLEQYAGGASALRNP